MSFVVETGSGMSTATAYVSIAEADSYHAERLHALPWQNADDETKAAAIIQATRLLDQIVYDGSPSTTTQALRWPRIGVHDHNGQSIASNTMPVALKRATAELARLMIDSDREADSAIPAEQSVSLGNASVSYAATGASRAPVPPHVLAMLRPFVAPLRAVRA